MIFYGDDNFMKTGNAIILTAALVLVVFVGIVVAEDFMMPQELEEKETVISLNGSDNATDAVNVKRHVPPRGVIQNFVLIFWDPFGHAPVDNFGLKEYNGALWYQYPDTTWIQVAFINENKQVTHIQTWNENIVNVIQDNYQTVDNMTVAIVEEPPQYDIGQSGGMENTNLNATDAEKINTTIDLKDQTLANDTNSTITGTLLDENGTAISDAEVTITVSGQSYTQNTDSNGQFTYEYNTESTDLTIGSNSMEVTYSGNETYNGVSKSITITLEAVDEEVDDTVEPTEADSYSDSYSSYDDSMDSYSSGDSYSSEDSYSSDDYYTVELLKVFS